METKETVEIKRLIACVELRNPKVFNANRERYLAEISFKAGEDKGYAHARQHCEDVIIPQAEAQARREVVEWIKEHSTLFIVGQDIADCAGNEISGETSLYPIVPYLEWEAQLKEWGIK